MIENWFVHRYRKELNGYGLLIAHQFHLPILKASDLRQVQEAKFSILHWASLEVVSTL